LGNALAHLAAPLSLSCGDASESADLGHKVRAFVWAAMRKRSAEKFITPHPSAQYAASHSQQTLKHMRETKMTKLFSIAAAFALVAPVAVAILAQAAQIVA
jgi:hypothetical protein